MLLATNSHAQIAQRTNPKVTMVARDSRAVSVAAGTANNLIAFSADPQNGARDVFHVITRESGLMVSLITPEGAEINAANATDRGFGYSVVNGNQHLNDQVMPAFSTPGTHTLFLLPSSSPSGTYQVKINASQVSAENVVIATYFSSSLIRAGLVTDAPTYRVGETVMLSGLLFNGALPVTGASVSVAIGEQSTLEAPPEQVAMQDSGSSDLASNDGIYTGTSTASRPGEFFVAMRATGSANGVTFSRLATTTFRVIPSLAKFSSFTDTGLDDNSDEQLDRVMVSANLDVQRAGKYQFAITLEAANGARAQASVVANLAAGAQQLSVAFASETLGTLGVNGPYKMKDAVLTLQDDPEPSLTDFRETAGTTAAYILSSLLSPPIVFTNMNIATGIDGNDNGKFDVLRIRSAVNVSAAGIYNWSGSLVDTSGEEIDFFNGSAELPQGSGAITFDFDGVKIGRHHAHGPYFVRFVQLSGNGKSLAVEKLFETQAFSVHEFEDSVLTPPQTSASLSQPANDAGWHNQSVRVSLVANDNTGGSSVRSITYSASDAQVVGPTTVAGPAATLLVKAEGITSITYSAVDNLGNTESPRTLTIKLDSTPPALVAPATLSAPSDINCQAVIPNVMLQVTASDLVGPFSLQQSPAPGTTVGVGSHAITVTATDGAGNSNTATTNFTVNGSASFSVSVNPSIVRRGNAVSLMAAYRNCASSRQALTLKVSLTGPSQQNLVAALPITLQPGQMGSLNIPIRIPSSTPTGLYSLTLEVYVGGIKTGTSTAQLTVIL